MSKGRHRASNRRLFALSMACLIQTQLVSASVTLTVQENTDSINSMTGVGSPLGAGINLSHSFLTAHYVVSTLFGFEQQSVDQTQLLSSTILISKSSNSNDVLHITVTGTGFTSPLSANVLSAVSATSTYSGTRPGNTLAFESTVGTAALGFQNPVITSTRSSADNKSASLAIPSSPFSIVQTIDLVLINSGDVLSFGGNTTLTATPEPSAAAFSLMGLSLLKRRRRA